MNGAESGLMPDASRDQARAILGAMRAVAEAGGEGASDADRRALAAADRFIFRDPEPLDLADLRPVDPAGLAAALGGGALARDAVMFLTVMAFVGGALDDRKIASVMAYAAALGVDEAYLQEVRYAAAGHLQQALADMSRRNIESITERPWPGGDPAAWLLPYADGKADPALVARFEGLATLPDDSFGRAFWTHSEDNGYAFPGTRRASTRSSPCPTIRLTCSPATTPPRTGSSWSPPSPPPCTGASRWPATSCP
jgi:hypothetical protein